MNNSSDKLSEFFKLIHSDVEMHIDEGDVHLARNGLITAAANLFMYAKEHGSVPEVEQDSLQSMALSISKLANEQFIRGQDGVSRELIVECEGLGQFLGEAIEAAATNPDAKFPYQMRADF